MKELGITEEINIVESPDTKPRAADAPEEYVKNKVFEADEADNIIINYYALTGAPCVYRKEGNKLAKRYIIRRLKNPVIDKDGHLRKYEIPKGAGTFPFLPPQLIKKYRAKEKIKTLVLTEGAFKAFKGAMHGLDIAGLTSITHYKDKDTQTMHTDILAIIKECEVENVIWLVDGDCRDLSSKWKETDEEGKQKEVDLYQRPAGFFYSAKAVKDLLTDMEINIYFANVVSDAVKSNPKGLDDLFIALESIAAQEAAEKAGNRKKKTESEEAKRQARLDIVSDLMAISRPGRLFHKVDITYNLTKLRDYFHIKTAKAFYDHYNQQIKESEFIFNGTKYKYSAETSELDIVVPAAARNYIRVGDDYYERVPMPVWSKDGDKTGTEIKLHRRQKQTIIDDHGKNFWKHIVKYKAFTIWPDNANYQQVVSGCYNKYSQITHEPEEGDCEVTMGFLKHIFGSGTITYTDPDSDKKEKRQVSELDVGLDYLQVLYQKPFMHLPILCLVSNERNTGKTTFQDWLKAIYGQNMALVGNADLANDFNAHWSSKLIISCDETKIDKHVVVEKIKNLSTASHVTMNAKGRDQEEVPFFGKFIFLSNNEDNFIYADDEEVRFWIRKIPPIKKGELKTGMLREMISEIPAFLSMMEKRRFATKNQYRHWFLPEIIETDALRKVISFSKPAVEREIREKVRDMFLEFGLPEIMMTKKDIKNEWFRGSRYEEYFIRKVLHENMKVDLYHELTPDGKKHYKTTRYSYPKMGNESTLDGTGAPKRLEVLNVGRPYVFKIEDFLNEQEISEVKGDELIKELAAPPPPEKSRFADDDDVGPF